MTTPFHKTAAFRKLNAEWQKKLADSGFEDVEYGRDQADTKMAKHHLSDRAAAQRGASTGGADMQAAISELRNHAVYSTLLFRVVWALASLGVTEDIISRSLSASKRSERKPRYSRVHNMLNEMRAAARQLAASGLIHRGDSDETQTN